ncbi:MAG: sporulation protein [Streptomyces sp.]|nr:sporulation protein [Streptomyces sp.]
MVDVAAEGTGRRENERLQQIIAEAGISHKRIAFRLNSLCKERGVPGEYTHTSVANWCRRGMHPRPPIPELLCTVVAEGLGRPVDLVEIGMEWYGRTNPDVGLAFPRDQREALKEAQSYWSTLNRRDFLTSAPFAISAFTEPVTRWLVRPTEPLLTGSGRVSVGAAHIAELREAADSARIWDSRFGGSGLKSRSLTAFLYERVTPLLRGTYSTNVGRELFSVTAEMARLAGWTAFDAGRQHAAQRHYIQALRLAKAAGDASLGSYVLSTMAMQALMRGFTSQAIDMAQGAYERVPSADPRVLGFAKLVEARGHARARDGRSASTCLSQAEALQQRGDGTASEITWIDFFTRQRIVTDAAEIFRDLSNPRATLAWHAMGEMPTEAFARSHAIRLSVLASAHAQQGDLEHSLKLGRKSLRLFTRLQTVRGIDYIRIYTKTLEPWRRENSVAQYMGEVRAAAAEFRAA